MARTIARDHDQKRANILKTAAKVFATTGYDRASMAQLATACGVSKANIYHYYPAKEALLFDILDNYLSMLRDSIFSVQLDGLSPEEKLRATLHKILLSYQGADHEHQLQLNALKSLPDSEQARLIGYQRDMVRFLSDVIHGAAPDIFSEDRDKLRATTMSVFGMLNWYYMWNSGAGTDARDNYAELVANLTLKGLDGI